jgi:hypothetical protein
MSQANWRARLLIVVCDGEGIPNTSNFLLSQEDFLANSTKAMKPRLLRWAKKRASIMLLPETKNILGLECEMYGGDTRIFLPSSDTLEFLSAKISDLSIQRISEGPDVFEKLGVRLYFFGE